MVSAATKRLAHYAGPSDGYSDDSGCSGRWTNVEARPIKLSGVCPTPVVINVIDISTSAFS